MNFFVKLGLTALLITLISEVAKRSTTAAGILAALPTISLLSIVWIYLDSKNVEQIASFSKTIFWGVIPSLIFFILLPLLLHRQWGFWWALGLSCAGTSLGFFLYALILKKWNISL